MTAAALRVGYDCNLRERYQLDICGARIRICEDVYEPAEDTWMVSEALERLNERHGICVDIGTGTGAIAACMKKVCSYTIATDISPCAVKCASILIGPLIDIVQCDGVTCLRRDAAALLVFNAPYLPGKPRSMIDASWYGGVEPVIRVLETLTSWRRCWSLIATLSSVSPADKAIEYAELHGLHWERLRCLPEDFFVETCVYLFTPARCALHRRR